MSSGRGRRVDVRACRRLVVSKTCEKAMDAFDAEECNQEYEDSCKDASECWKCKALLDGVGGRDTVDEPQEQSESGEETDEAGLLMGERYPRGTFLPEKAPRFEHHAQQHEASYEGHYSRSAACVEVAALLAEQNGP